MSNRCGPSWQIRVRRHLQSTSSGIHSGPKHRIAEAYAGLAIFGVSGICDYRYGLRPWGDALESANSWPIVFLVTPLLVPQRTREANLVQLLVLRFSLLQDGDVG